jgi:RNA polymerase sigma factor (sigma-70 family)
MGLIDKPSVSDNRPEDTEGTAMNSDDSAPDWAEGIPHADAFPTPPSAPDRSPMESPSSPSGGPISTPDEEDGSAREVSTEEQREADARLLENARSDPRAFELLRDTLIAYALPVTAKKIVDGEIWREASREVGMPAPAPNPPAVEPQEVESLAGEVVTRAFNRFRRHGLYKWDPNGGVSLTTWFYRDCLYQFSNAVRAWSKDRRELAPSMTCLLGLDELNEGEASQLGHRRVASDLTSADPEAAALSAVRLSDRLHDIERALGPRTRMLIEKHAVDGRPLTEVAGEMGISRQKAHRMLSRCRQEMIKIWGEKDHG